MNAGIGRGGPDGEHAAGPQRRAGRRQPGSGIEPVIAGPAQAVGTIVDIEQDGVEGRVAGLDRRSDVGGLELHARIVEAVAEDRGERAARPGDDLGDELDDADARSRALRLPAARAG